MYTSFIFWMLRHLVTLQTYLCLKFQNQTPELFRCSRDYTVLGTAGKRCTPSDNFTFTQECHMVKPRDKQGSQVRRLLRCFASLTSTLSMSSHDWWAHILLICTERCRSVWWLTVCACPQCRRLTQQCGEESACKVRSYPGKQQGQAQLRCPEAAGGEKTDGWMEGLSRKEEVQMP